MALGSAVGKLYVAKHFSVAARTKVAEIASHVRAAFVARIDRLDWMSTTAKSVAKAKLAALEINVGYPDRSVDYSTLNVDRYDSYGNQERIVAFRAKALRSRLLGPVDRREWTIDPQDHQAVNIPFLSSVTFAAGILQVPVFDPSWPDAMIYGALGSLVGHELGHTFDPGNLRVTYDHHFDNWLTPQDRAHLATMTKPLVTQYGAYKPLAGATVDGAMTLDENFADLLGLSVAFDAYRAAGAGGTAVAGFTPDQQFFLAFAQSPRPAREALVS